MLKIIGKGSTRLYVSFNGKITSILTEEFKGVPAEAKMLELRISSRRNILSFIIKYIKYGMKSWS